MMNDFYKQIGKKKNNLFWIKLPKRSNDVYLEIWVKAGFCFVDQKNKELPHLLEHCIAHLLMLEDFDYDASTRTECVVYSIKTTKKEMNNTFIKFLQAVFSPNISEEIFRYEKRALINEKAGQFDQPGDIISNLAQNEIVGKTWYSVSDSVDDAKLINLSDIINFHKKYYSLVNTKAFVGADIIKADNDIFFEHEIDKYANAKTSQAILPPIKYPAKKIIKNKILNTNQVYIAFIWPGLNYKNSAKDYIEINTIKDILTNGYKSILFQELRVKRGLIYWIDSELWSLSHFGIFQITTACQPEDYNDVVKVVTEIANKGIGGQMEKKEFKRRIKRDIGDTKKEWLNNKDRFDWVVWDLAIDRKFISSKEVIKINRDLTLEKLGEISKKYLGVNKMNIFTVGLNGEHR